MGNACNFAKEDEELTFEKYISAMKESRQPERNSTCDSMVSAL